MNDWPFFAGVEAFLVVIMIAACAVGYLCSREEARTGEELAREMERQAKPIPFRRRDS